MTKPFFVISALLNDSSQLGNLKRHDTEKEAIDHAKNVIDMRRQKSQPDITFYVLKVTAKVGVERSPIKVQKLK